MGGRKSSLPKIVEALELAPAGLTQIELQRITGCAAGTVHLYIHKLHDEGEAYIASWKTDGVGWKNGGVFQARYRLGKEADVPKPSPMPKQEVYRRYIARLKSTKGGMEELRAIRAEREKRRYWKKKPVRRDPMIAAMFGMGA